MANLGTVLKDEITCLARKVIKSEVDSIRKTNVTYRRDIAALKRQVAQLEKDNKALSHSINASAPRQEETAEAPKGRSSLSRDIIEASMPPNFDRHL